MTTALSTEATELREQAAAKFKEANDYLESLKGRKDDAGNDVALSAEEEKQFQGIIAGAKGLDEKFREKAGAEGARVDLKDAWDFYFGKATGRLPHWNAQTIERPKSLGQEFAESESYKELVESGALASDHSAFRTKAVRQEKAASDVIRTGTGGPAEDLLTPQYLPGILPFGQRPLTVRDLFSQGVATSDLISYAAQIAFDSGAAAVAQATAVNDGAKPQSSIAWERRTSAVQTIATWMAATRQTLADAGQVQSLIDNQGRLMLELEEEDQLMSGNGTAPNLRGLLNVVGVQTLAVDADNLDAIRTARTMVRTGTSRMRADAIVLHPNDSERFDLLKDLNNQYRGGNPVGNFTFDQPLWGLRRVESEAVEEGTAVVGAFKAGATVFERQGITVYTTDSHADFFIRNLIVILFEERLAFPVFFPTAFVKMTLAEWAAGS